MDVWWLSVGATMLASLLLVGGGALLATDQRRISRWRRRIEGRAGKGAASRADCWKQRGVHVLATCGRLAASARRDGAASSARFLTAGLRNGNAPLLFDGAKLLGAAACAVLALVLLQFCTACYWWNTLLLAGVGGLGGWYGPEVWLRSRMASRQQHIEEGFPSALDLLVICVEAGLSLDVALNRVSQEAARMHRELSQELQLLCVELRNGQSRQAAFRHAAQRMQVEEVHAFMAVLIQTERFGTSIGQALRIHADGLRTRQDLRATEIASQLPVKLLFPLIFFIFPGLFVVLLGPAIIRGLRLLSDVAAP